MTKVYISGAISSDPDYLDKFRETELAFQYKGFKTCNPARETIKAEGKTWEEYMREAVRLMMDCDCIVMLRDWKKSKGAKIEHSLAKKLGYTILYQK